MYEATSELLVGPVPLVKPYHEAPALNMNCPMVAASASGSINKYAGGVDALDGVTVGVLVGVGVNDTDGVTDVVTDGVGVNDVDGVTDIVGVTVGVGVGGTGHSAI